MSAPSGVMARRASAKVPGASRRRRDHFVRPQEISTAGKIADAAARGAESTGIEQKIGDLYNSFMDEAAAEAKVAAYMREHLAELPTHQYTFRASAPLPVRPASWGACCGAESGAARPAG